MVSKKNRSGNIKSDNINVWTGQERHKPQEGEQSCDECNGAGGFCEDIKAKGTGLIKRCQICLGKGYLDWVDVAKGKTDQYVEFTMSSQDKKAFSVDEGKEEEFIEMIRMNIEGEFKFVDK